MNFDDDPVGDAREYGRQLAMDGLLAQALKTSGLRRRRPIRFGIIAAAAALLLAVLGYFVLRPGDGPAFRLEEARGDVSFEAGNRVTTRGRGSSAVLRFRDGTRVEIGADSSVDRIEDGDLGKRVTLASGWVSAKVMPQPPGREMRFVTPHGEATVAGTVLRLLIDPGEGGSTRLEVDEGKVRLKRKLDERAVDVVGGQAAVAAAGVELAAVRMDGSSRAGPEILAEDFEGYAPESPIDGQGGWSGGRVPPIHAVVRAGAGVGNSRALALWQEGREDLLPWSYGVQRDLAEPLGGVAWVQCSFKPPRLWKVPFHLDLRSGPEYERILFLASAARDAEGRVGAHATWRQTYWRLYRTLQGGIDGWHTFTLRADFDRNVTAAWVDGRLIGEDLEMSHSPPAALLHLSMAGTREEPGFVDNLIVSRLAPPGFRLPAPIPSRRPDLLFRFAAMGEVRLGDADVDIKRLFVKRAVGQINRAGADLTMLMGNVAAHPGEEQSYRDLAADVGGLARPFFPVRGSQDRKDLFRRHFRKEPASTSIVQNGVRFVLLDADDRDLGWTEGEFRKAREAREEIVVVGFSSPWDGTYGGIGPVARMGPEAARLKALLKEYQALVYVSCHYPMGPWHEEADGTHFLSCGGPILRRGVPAGWSLFDVYGDRIEVHFKPLFSGAPQGEAKEYLSGGSGGMFWESYDGRKAYPDVRGPLVFKRHRPVR